MEVKTFNMSELELEIERSSKIIRDYIKSLKLIIELDTHVINNAKKKISELSNSREMS